MGISGAEGLVYKAGVLIGLLRSGGRPRDQRLRERINVVAVILGRGG